METCPQRGKETGTTGFCGVSCCACKDIFGGEEFACGPCKTFPSNIEVVAVKTFASPFNLGDSGSWMNGPVLSFVEPFECNAGARRGYDDEPFADKAEKNGTGNGDANVSISAGSLPSDISVGVADLDDEVGNGGGGGGGGGGELFCSTIFAGTIIVCPDDPASRLVS